MEITCVANTHSKIGEGAYWDDRAQRLWWVDIPAGLIHCYNPDNNENSTVEFGEPVGCLAVREQGGLVLATKSGFWFFDPDSGKRTAIADPEANIKLNRFNDGTIDQQGRFWAGTMRDGGEPGPYGSFYRLDPDLSVTTWKNGYFTTNGLAFSPDGTKMYFSDTNRSVQTIWISDYDCDTGTPGEPRVFFDSNQVKGRPDGGTIDADGNYWYAGIDGWHLYQISPSSELVKTIELPMERPSKPMFGGPNLDIMFITSLGIGLSPSHDTEQPEAGGLFAIHGLGIQGLPQPRFAG